MFYTKTETMNLQAATQIADHAREYGMDLHTSYVILDGVKEHYIEFGNLTFNNASAAVMFIEAIVKERQLYHRLQRIQHVA